MELSAFCPNPPKRSRRCFEKNALAGLCKMLLLTLQCLSIYVWLQAPTSKGRANGEPVPLSNQGVGVLGPRIQQRSQSEILLSPQWCSFFRASRVLSKVSHLWPHSARAQFLAFPALVALPPCTFSSRNADISLLWKLDNTHSQTH